MAKRFSSYTSPNYRMCEAVIISEPQIFIWTDPNDEIKKAKTVFRMKSLTSGKEIDCIVWTNSTCRIGDKIRVEGRLEKDGKAFIVWNNKDGSSKLVITERAVA